LKALFRANDRFARKGSALLAKRGDDLARGIGALGDLVDFQLANRGEIEKSLTYLPQFLHAIEDSSVPWRSPDGRFFYRIRAGLVLDNVRATWPCAYDLPFEYQRMPHLRDKRNVVTDAECIPPSGSDTLTAESAEALVTALRDWAARSTDAPVAAEVDTPVVAGYQPTISVGFQWPLSGVITSPFGPRGSSMHEGIDIDGVTGDPVAASAGGTVLLARPFSGYGNAVIVDHGDGITTLYGHLSAFAVQEGEAVGQGQTIGAVGSTGHSTGDHLHFEIRVNGTPVDPLPYLPGGSKYLLPPATIPEVEAVASEREIGGGPFGTPFTLKP
ncbi:MAG: M23 family metallopeptidase, partial [Actinobacteria bacterium]|nr:M23 family metallopeptidase [Actinomycetota bacterium]